MEFKKVGKTSIEFNSGERGKINDAIELLSQLLETIEDISQEDKENDIEITYMERGELYCKDAEYMIEELSNTIDILEIVYGIRSIESLTKTRDEDENFCGKIFNALKEAAKKQQEEVNQKEQLENEVNKSIGEKIEEAENE